VPLASSSARRRFSPRPAWGRRCLPEWTAAPLTPATLALTHLLTLGFLAMAMLGALSQMLR